MALFTFDDLNEMKKDESDFFGSSDHSPEENLSPSAAALNGILSYSCSLSVRKTQSLGNIKFNLN